MKDFNEFSAINEYVDDDTIKSVDDATNSKNDLEETTEEENTEEENTEEEETKEEESEESEEDKEEDNDEDNDDDDDDDDNEGSDSDLHKALSCLFLSRSQTHYYHFQTESFAEHKALNAYYDSLLLLTDELIEVAQGEFGRVKGKIEITIEDYDRDSMLNHFKETLECVRECRSDNENNALSNIYDEIETLIMKTQYLLSLK